MNAVAAVAVAPSPRVEAVSAPCFHCAEALPPSPARLFVDGTERLFCCAGCAAAAQWIRDARLDDYYALRTAPATRVTDEDADLGVWDGEEVLAEHALPIAGGLELTLLTDGMRCAACAWLIDRALTREPGVLEVTANAITGRIRIAWDPARTTLSRPLHRLLALGYRPYLATGAARERARRSERNRWLLRLGIAGLGAMQAMMFAEALFFGEASAGVGAMSVPMRDFLRWITFLVATPVVFYSGWPFLYGAWHELRERRAGMDTLVAASTLLAYGASVVETVRGGPHVWYDAAVMFVFLLLAARMLEQRVRNVASAQVDAIARARPTFAIRERADGSRECVRVGVLAAGDIVCVAAGEAVPVDGTLIGDDACFEESMLTGEAQPLHKTAGAAVFAGTVCREKPARVLAAIVGHGTRLSQLAALVERAQAHRPPLAQAADRIAGWFVLGLAIVAACVFLAWRAHDPARAFEVTLALLVISCPCALSLSVPAALAAANGALARMGVLPVRADALARLARTTDVVFDKTGTLSAGVPQLLDVTVHDGFDKAQALRIACALERDSRHPLAAAFVDADIQYRLRARKVTTVAGSGIQGDVDGAHWRLGQAPFACGGDDDGALWLGDGTRAAARFVLGECTREEAPAAIATLRAQGLQVHLSSGDAAEAVARCARSLDLTEAHGRQTPEAKLEYVRSLQRDGRVVAMVGDGLNDAPVLAGADVSLAIGDGAALAQRAADLVLAAPSLLRVPAAIALARRARAVIRQNLAWAIGYNLLALPLAAAGLVTPWLAAVGMTLSSLAVTLNALRLARATQTVRA